MRKAKNAWNGATAIPEHVEPIPYSLPREQLDPPSCPKVDPSSEHLVPEVYCATPQHVAFDVMA